MKIITCKLCGLKVARSKKGNAQYCLVCARIVNKDKDKQRLKIRRMKEKK